MGLQPSRATDLSRHTFGSGPPFTVGVEEELFLVDPLTGAQINASTAVQERVGPVDGTVERELHACQLELITEVCESAGEAIDALEALRRAVVATGTGLLGAGTHPSGAEGDSEITDKERYERIRYLLGDAVATPVGGLHIHVGMPDPETAIRAFNGLRRHLPLLQALAANSPFRHGRDTGLASAREVTLRGWPRSGAPRAMRDFEDFCSTAALLARAADVPDYTWFWWKLRPHPRLGTVEIRALDAQASLEDTAALVALTHCLARHAVEAEPGPDPRPEVLEEGMFRAARFGVAAELPDPDGRLRPVSELLEAALDGARDHADELGCAAALDELRALLRRGGGAGRQRAAYEIGGMGALLRELTQLTGAGTAAPAEHPEHA
ncbi:MAG: carboxylate-amine ligase [Solirubrobacteraceae bacterium]